MRWVTSATVLAAIALAGCGNYSTEDLRFLAALPRREDLRVEVPAQPGPIAVNEKLAASALSAGACGSGTADVWLWAKPTSDRLNAGVDLVVSLVDAVRRHPPSWRDDDARRWGPFDDEKHPGREIQVLMLRSHPPELEGAPVHTYAFQARVKGSAEFTTVLAGRFEGASASRGKGWVVLDFEELWRLAMNDPETPHGKMTIGYDRASEPVTIGVRLAQDGFGLVQFEYGFAGYGDGSGAFYYALHNERRDLLEIATSYDPAGGGRGAVKFTAVGGATGSFRQCWNGEACLVYVDDPANYSGACEAAPCTTGTLDACPSVPVSLF